MEIQDEEDDLAEKINNRCPANKEEIMNRSLPRKTLLAAATISALGISAPASADIVQFNWSGYFTMLTSAGSPVVSTDYQSNNMLGNRTSISGAMTIDTYTGAGTATINPFYFFAGSYWQTTQFNLQAIGDGSGNTAGTLVLGNMLFNWGGNNDIPVSIVLDAAGLFGAMSNGPLSPGQTISGVGTYGASDGMASGAYHMGLLPIATTTWNTTTVPGATWGSNPSGMLPLVTDTSLATNYDGDPLTAGYQNACAADAVSGTNSGQSGWQCALGIGGSSMITAPFAGYNANFDIASMTVTSVVIVDPAPVPVPAAIWLLGSGLLGLLGMTRRKRS